VIVAAVRRLHAPHLHKGIGKHDPDIWICSECMCPGHSCEEPPDVWAWPCPTVKALPEEYHDLEWGPKYPIEVVYALQ
jgi:hypothetical protein